MKKIVIKMVMTIVLLTLTCSAWAQYTREDLAKIRVDKEGNFKYWNEDSPALQKLKDFVLRVTDESSTDFVPVEHRIATFDVDGTLICETAPTYYNWMLYLHRMLNDDSYTPSAEQKELAQQIYDAVYNRASMPKGASDQQQIDQAMSFAGLTQQEMEEYVTNFNDTTHTSGLTNLTWGTACYWPMIEVVSYLVSNDFQVYVCSGCDRDLIRATLKDVYPIMRNHIIASDVYYLPEKLAEEFGYVEPWSMEDYAFDQTKGQQVVRGAMKNLCTKYNKVDAITRELGQQPILAWGNSSGDYAMYEFTTTANPYPSIAFSLLCDDTERELGMPETAAKVKTVCEENGWVSVSMRDEWKTIYGDNVTRNETTKQREGRIRPTGL